jgi:hypothetical protein
MVKKALAEATKTGVEARTARCRPAKSSPPCRKWRRWPTAPPVAAPGLALEAVKNRHTGVDFMPGGGNPQASTNPTSPAPMPTPASPGVGAGQGIETQRNDGVKQ